MRRLFIAMAGSAAIGATAGCAYNEALGRNQILLVDDASLAQAASAAWAQTLSKGRLSRNAGDNARVRAIGRRVVEAAGLGGQSWEYVVFEDPSVNAFVLPGGRMGVNTGLLRLVQNDAQLAAVIGHEVAHTAARHAAERQSNTALAQISVGVAGAAAGDSRIGQAIGQFGGAGAQLGFLLPFSRQHELEADRLGVDYMHRAGFPPVEALNLWRLMAQRGAQRAPEFTSTHPSEATRIAQLEAYIRSRGWA
jgi:predicted Zn-dependent protease